MENIILKYGGVCTANSNNIKLLVQNVIKNSSLTNRIFVVLSAPGIAENYKTKITDSLIEIHNLITQKQNFLTQWKKLCERFVEIAKPFNLEKFTKQILNQTKVKIINENNYDFTLSRGEYLTAKLIAKITNGKFLDAKDLLFFKNNELDFEKSKKSLNDIKSSNNIFVVPGFYANFSGKIKIFTRDGSDYTGSLMALISNATVYKNIKDVNGLMTASPRIILKPKQAYKISFKNLKLLTANGAKLLHSSTISPLIKTQTKLFICNLFSNKKPTIATNENIKVKNGFASVTVKNNLILVTIEKKENYLSHLAKSFEIFGDLGLKLFWLVYENDEILLIFERENFNLIKIMNAYEIGFYLKENISQITIVGINYNKNVIKKIKKALEKNLVYPIHITTSDNLSCIKVLVEDKYYESAYLAIYNAFYKKFFIFHHKLT